MSGTEWAGAAKRLERRIERVEKILEVVTMESPCKDCVHKLENKDICSKNCIRLHDFQKKLVGIVNVFNEDDHQLRTDSEARKYGI